MRRRHVRGSGTRRLRCRVRRADRSRRIRRWGRGRRRVREGRVRRRRRGRFRGRGLPDVEEHEEAARDGEPCRHAGRSHLRAAWHTYARRRHRAGHRVAETQRGRCLGRGGRLDKATPNAEPRPASRLLSGSAHRDADASALSANGTSIPASSATVATRRSRSRSRHRATIASRAEGTSGWSVLGGAGGEPWSTSTQSAAIVGPRKGSVPVSSS